MNNYFSSQKKQNYLNDCIFRKKRWVIIICSLIFFSFPLKAQLRDTTIHIGNKSYYFSESVKQKELRQNFENKIQKNSLETYELNLHITGTPAYKMLQSENYFFTTFDMEQVNTNHYRISVPADNYSLGCFLFHFEPVTHEMAEQFLFESNISVSSDTSIYLYAENASNKISFVRIDEQGNEFLACNTVALKTYNFYFNNLVDFYISAMEHYDTAPGDSSFLSPSYIYVDDLVNNRFIYSTLFSQPEKSNLVIKEPLSGPINNNLVFDYSIEDFKHAVLEYDKEISPLRGMSFGISYLDKYERGMGFNFFPTNNTTYDIYAICNLRSFTQEYRIPVYNFGFTFNENGINSMKIDPLYFINDTLYSSCSFPPTKTAIRNNDNFYLSFSDNYAPTFVVKSRTNRSDNRVLFFLDILGQYNEKGPNSDNAFFTLKKGSDVVNSGNIIYSNNSYSINNQLTENTNYTLILENQYSIFGIQGISLAELNFKTDNKDLCPPVITSFRVTNQNGDIVNDLFENENYFVSFSAADFDAGLKYNSYVYKDIKRAELFWKNNLSEQWNNMIVEEETNQFSQLYGKYFSGSIDETILSEVNESLIDFKIVLYDNDDNTSTYQIKPVVKVNNNTNSGLYNASFNVTDYQNNEISDAIITFNNLIHQQGNYIFSDLVNGRYSYIVQKEGYNEYTGNVAIYNQDAHIEVVLDNGTQIIDNNNSKITVFPNPASDYIQISLDKNVGNESKIEIFNIQGKIVFSNTYYQTGSFNINLSNLLNGIYIVKIITGNQVSMQKLIIQ